MAAPRIWKKSDRLQLYKQYVWKETCNFPVLMKWQSEKTITFLIRLWSSGCSGKTKVVVQSQAPVVCQSVPEQDPDPQSVPVCEWTWGGIQWGSLLPLLCEYVCEGECRNRKTLPNKSVFVPKLTCVHTMYENPGLICWYGSCIILLPLNGVLHPASPDRSPALPTFSD